MTSSNLEQMKLVLNVQRAANVCCVKTLTRAPRGTRQCPGVAKTEPSHRDPTAAGADQEGSARVQGQADLAVPGRIP